METINLMINGKKLVENSYEKNGVNKNYIVGILDDSSVIPNPSAAQKSKRIN